MNIYSSTHSFNTLSTYDSGADLLKELRVIKNEEFGFFVAFNVEKRAYVSLGIMICLGGGFGTDTALRPLLYMVKITQLPR